jgi:hypothetical protein
MTRRADLWHPAVTPVNVGGAGVLTLATTFLETNSAPGWTAAIGAMLIGVAVRLRYKNSEPSAGGDSATTVADSRPTKRAA